MIGYLVVYVVLSTTGLILLRARLRSGEPINQLLLDPLLLIGAMCYALSFFTWLLTLRSFELTRAFPIFLGSSYAAVMVASVVLLNEQLTSSRLAGLVFVGVGMLLITR